MESLGTAQIMSYNFFKKGTNNRKANIRASIKSSIMYCTIGKWRDCCTHWHAQNFFIKGDIKNKVNK